MKRFLAWLNKKLNIVETSSEANEYYSWADRRLDELAAIEADLKRVRSDVKQPYEAPPMVDWEEEVKDEA